MNSTALRTIGRFYCNSSTQALRAHTADDRGSLAYYVKITAFFAISS